MPNESLFTIPVLSRRTAKEVSRLIQEEATYICKAMDELEIFRKKPTLLREYCSRLHEIENQADDVYEFFITEAI